MKKIWKIALTICVIIALMSGWLYAYRHTKNTDNLPSLETLQADDLEELVGYQRVQLINVWGNPDDTIGTDQEVWDLEGERYLLVIYGSNGRVKEARFQ